MAFYFLAHGGEFGFQVVDFGLHGGDVKLT
jgi:hypothetical protein